jgi:hypothetical protein
MGRTLEAVVEDLPNASAGGHARMGGGQIQERVALPNGGEEEVESVPRPELVDRLFRSMSGDI